MKKLSLFASILLTACFVNAQTATSVQDGNFLSFSTWDCGGIPCIPIPGIHNVVINHDVVLDTNFAIISGTFDINSGASLIQDGTPRAFGMLGGTLTNNGKMVIDTFGIVAGTLTNNDSIWFDQFATFGTFNNNLGAFIYCDSIANFGSCTNYGIDSSLAFTNAGIYYNYSTINTYNFTNIGTLEQVYIVNVYNLWNTGTINNSSTINAVNYTNSNVHNNLIGFVGLFTSQLNTTNLWNMATLTNQGLITATNMISSGGYFDNDSSVVITSNFYLEGGCDNSNYIDVGENFYNGDTLLSSTMSYLTNDGTLNVGTNFWNADTIDGSGHICVGQNSVNDGVLLGTISFCDATGGAIDFNNGTVGSNVTYCDSSFTCFGPPPNGMAENVNQKDPSFYPNPTTGNINFDIQSNYQLEIFDIMGRKVLSQLLSVTSNSVSVEKLNSGVYLVRITSIDSKQVITQRLVKK
ncbi:MAG: T9SS type A sorting domain-containing protein [Flavobacteriales bacterium]|nr:T9SS type A sorting domain-containing protein [Flavobacteriales bacterium]